MVLNIRHPVLLYDTAEPITEKLTPSITLAESLDKARQLDTEHIPVTASGEDNSFISVLSCHAVRRLLSVEVLARQQKADNI